MYVLESEINMIFVKNGCQFSNKMPRLCIRIEGPGIIFQRAYYLGKETYSPTPKLQKLEYEYEVQ